MRSGIRPRKWNGCLHVLFIGRDRDGSTGIQIGKRQTF